MNELDDLMDAARRRVAHLIAIVVALMATISSQISFDVAALGSLLGWVLGCLVVLVLAFFWYRARAAATVRLAAVIRSGTDVIVDVEITRIRLYFIPIGVEVDLEFESGEHLSVGYWMESTAERLVELLAPLRPRLSADANGPQPASAGNPSP